MPGLLEEGMSDRRPSVTEIKEHYRTNVETLNERDLLRMVRGDFEKGTPKYIAGPLQDLAFEIAQERGIEFPYFASFFTT